MSAFVDRLVTQKILLHDRDVELEMANAVLNSKLNQEAELQSSVDLLQAQLDKVEGVRAVLESLSRESEEAHESVKAKEDAASQSLNEELKALIDSVNEESQTLTVAERAAEHENRTMKAHIAIYAEHDASNSNKLSELVKSREEEANKIRQKEIDSAARLPELEQLYTLGREQLDRAIRARDEVKAMVDASLVQYDAVRDQITQSKEAYDVAKEEQDRYTRTLRVLEDERDRLLSRAKRSRAERDAVLKKLTVVQCAAEKLRNQITTYNNVAKMLIQPAESAMNTESQVNDDIK